jgi:hypothetical protein
MKPTVELLADAPLIGAEGFDPFWDDVDPVRGHYDRNGEAISFRTWCRLCEHVPDYRRVAADTIGPYWVSTVWLGIDHGLRLPGWGELAIFETMVFKGEESDLDCRRYATEEDALVGHAEVVNEVSLLYEAGGEDRQ